MLEDLVSLGTLVCGKCSWLWQGGYVISKMALELLLGPPQTEVENQAGSGRSYAFLVSAMPGWVLGSQRGKDYKA